MNGGLIKHVERRNKLLIISSCLSHKAMTLNPREKECLLGKRSCKKEQSALFNIN